MGEFMRFVFNLKQHKSSIKLKFSLFPFSFLCTRSLKHTDDNSLESTIFVDAGPKIKEQSFFLIDSIFVLSMANLYLMDWHL